MTFRSLRRRAGLTQQSLAERTRKRGRSSLSQRVISKIECGETRNPQYATVIALAEALGTTPDTVVEAIRATPRSRKTEPTRLEGREP